MAFKLTVHQFTSTFLGLNRTDLFSLVSRESENDERFSNFLFSGESSTLHTNSITQIKTSENIGIRMNLEIKRERILHAYGIWLRLRKECAIDR